MAIASSREVVRAWARERRILLWVLGPGVAELAGAALDALRADGASVTALTGRPPFGVFAALRAAGLDDLRRVGVLGADAATLDGARRAGVAAAVGLLPRGAGAGERAALLRAEPDALVPADELASWDAEIHGSARPLRQRLMLNPGPVTTTERVRRAMTGPDVCHREPEYSALARRVRQKLLRVARAPAATEVALVAGSGTAALEIAVRAAVRPGRALLVCRNGVYGERIERMAARAGISTVTVDGAWTEPIDPGAVRAALYGEAPIDAVAVVHHETTTGLLNPVGAVAAAARAAGALVLVDAVSSFGGEQLETAAVDLLACSSNKCLHGQPGAAFVLASPAAVARALEREPTSVYLDLAAYLGEAVPFTPAVPVWLALEAALDELLEEGVEARPRSYRERAARVAELVERLGLEPLIAAELRSHSITAVRLPHGVAFPALHDSMRERGYVIYAGQGALAGDIFRISTMGAIELPALVGLEEDLRAVLDEVIAAEVALG